MKKKLVFFIQIIISLAVNAYPKINGIYYNFNTTNKTASVTYLSNYPRDNAKAYTGDVVIPEEVEYEGETYSVISISDRAFTTCSGLTSVIIPNSITSIGDYAFSGSHGLKKVIIPNTVSSIGINAFSACLTLETINIPNSLTTIKSETFNQCSCITSIIIPNSVKFIEKKAFQGCIGLTSIEIPTTVLDIEQNAFSNCSNLKEVIINSKYVMSKNYESDKAFNSIFGSQVVSYIIGDVNIIGNYAFQKCTGISSITIPNTIKSIGESAFAGCTSLMSIEIPNSVISIGKQAFYGCSNLTNVYLSNIINALADGVFWQCYSLSSIEIPNSVKTIGAGAFNSCTHLSSINIPNSITSIGRSAFANCSNLTNIVLPNSIKSIEDHAFSNCTSLTSVDIPNSIESIGEYAFRSCSSLVSITIPESVQQIKSQTFYGCSGLTSVIIPNSITAIYPSAFAYCISLTSLTIPSSVTTLWHNAFEGCSLLESVVLPNSISYMGYGIFKDTNISKVTFLHNKEELDLLNWDEQTKISDFKGPSGTTFLFSEDVKSKVGRNYFRYRVDAFKYWMDENPACFEGINKEGYAEGIFVKVVVDKDESWIPINGKLVDNYFEISGPVNSSFLKAVVSTPSNNSKEVTLDLTEVNSHSDGTGDKYQITSIGFEAFRGMPITGITLPETLKELGGSSLRETSLRKVVIPNSLTSIGGTVNRSSDQFRGCSKLNTVVLGKNIESIGEVVFSKCDSLEIFVSLPMTPPTLDDTSFIYWGTSETTFKGHPYGIIVHNDVLEEYQNAEYWKDLKYFQSFETTPIYVKVDTLSRKGSSARLLFYPVDAAHNYGDISNGEELVINGLEPRANMSGMKVNWKTKDGNFGTAILDIQTSAFTIETNEPKALNTTKARLIASADEYDDMTHYGFEWRRIDAPDLIASSKVAAPLYNGQIVGTLNNLNPDTYYKYRPFYTSDSGDTHYGEWIGLFTGDANVYFEPEVYTKDAADITKVSALLAGVWFEGTDDIEEKGFEYWTVSNNKTRAAGSDVKKIIVSGSGNTMTTTLEGLKSGATYGYRSYVKTTSGKTTNGEEKTFQTVLIGDVDGDGELTKADVDAIAMHIIGQTPKGFNKKMADVNEDGKINAVDIVMLINIIK